MSLSRIQCFPENKAEFRVELFLGKGTAHIIDNECRLLQYEYTAVVYMQKYSYRPSHKKATTRK